MWIMERNGKYIFRERYKGRDGKYHSVSVTCRNKTRATVKRATEQLGEMIRERTAEGGCTAALSSVLDDYVAFKRPEVKPITLAGYTRMQQRIYQHFPPKTRITDISAREWQKFLDGVTAESSAGVARTLYRFIKAAMEQAERLDGISALSIRRVRVQMPKKSVADVEAAGEKFLTREELHEVLGLLREKAAPYIADICEFQALTGLRYGELAALREEDYDPVKKEISVNATLNFNYQGHRCHRGTPKNIYSVRKVSLDKRAATIIENFITTDKASRAWFHAPGFQLPDRFIFISRTDGYPVDISYMNKVLRSLHYHKRLTTHIFRHTHISLLAEENVPLKAIMARVGHNEPRTTMAVYTHVTEKMKREALDALNTLSL